MATLVREGNAWHAIACREDLQHPADCAVDLSECDAGLRIGSYGTGRNDAGARYRGNVVVVGLSRSRALPGATPLLL